MWKKKKSLARRTKASTFIVFLNSSSILQKTFIHQRKKNIKKYSDLEKKRLVRRIKKLRPLLCYWKVHPSARKYSFFREKTNIKKLSDMGEEEKICEKNKSFNL